MKRREDHCNSTGLPFLGDIGGNILCFSDPGRGRDPWDSGRGFDGGRGSFPDSLINSRGCTISVGSCGPLLVLGGAILPGTGANSGEFPRWMSLADVKPVRLELAPDLFSLESDEPGRGLLTAGAETDLCGSDVVAVLTPSPV